MAEAQLEGRRIAIEKDLASFAMSLTPGGEFDSAPFPTIADLLAFAAALGGAHCELMAVVNRAKQPDPIRREVFATRNYETLIDLLAAYEKQDVRTLQSSDESVNERLEIFEGYANAGLRYLKEKLDPFADKLEGLELLLGSCREGSGVPDAAPDISDLA